MLFENLVKILLKLMSNFLLKMFLKFWWIFMKIVQKYPRKVVTTLGSILNLRRFFQKKRIASRALPLREGKQIVVSLRGDFLNQVEKHCGYRNFMWSDPSMMSSFFVAFLSLKTIQKIFDMTNYFPQNRTLWPGQSLSSPIRRRSFWPEFMSKGKKTREGKHMKYFLIFF